MMIELGGPSIYLGLEIGGTKLQLGLGRGDGTLTGFWRGTVDRAAGAGGILATLAQEFPRLLAAHRVEPDTVRGVGIGFGGPVNLVTQTVQRSHQVTGWEQFPLGTWCRDTLGPPGVVANDADVAGLAECRFGAGQGLSPVFYVTLGSGVGGALILNGHIYTGAGCGAAELGHLPANLAGNPGTVESFASGWGLSQRAGLPSGEAVAEAVRAGDSKAQAALNLALDALANGLHQVILLLCPKRIIIGGGLAHLGDELLFQPLRERLQANIFPPFAGLTDIVPAALGENMVVQGALALAAETFADLEGSG